MPREIPQEEIQHILALFEEKSPGKRLPELHLHQMGLMAVLHYIFQAEKQLSSKDLTQALQVTSARMTVLLRKLEQEGFITKHTDPADKRFIWIDLTPEGKAQVQRLQEQKYRCVEKLLQEMTCEEVETFVKQLDLFHHIIETTVNTEEGR